MEWVIIPILALLIPISAIVLNSEVGKALVQRVVHLEHEMTELREQNAFLRQLRDEASDE